MRGAIDDVNMVDVAIPYVRRMRVVSSTTVLWVVMKKCDGVRRVVERRRSSSITIQR